eukprot:10017243-Ditylum_brightwellii.AAC.1
MTAARTQGYNDAYVRQYLLIAFAAFQFGFDVSFMSLHKTLSRIGPMIQNKNVLPMLLNKA